MDRPGKNGGPSVREHLTSAWRQTGIMPAMLAEEPDPPLVAEHVFQWFNELCAARGASGFGPAPLSHSEIEAWARLCGRYITPLDVEWLRLLDHEWLTAFLSDTEGSANGDRPEKDQPAADD